jgi:hypothetical protein
LVADVLTRFCEPGATFERDYRAMLAHASLVTSSRG